VERIRGDWYKHTVKRKAVAGRFVVSCPKGGDTGVRIHRVNSRLVYTGCRSKWRMMISNVCWLIVLLVMIGKLGLIMQGYSISIRLDEITVVGEDIWRQS
jgi:hypothetical protein